MSLENKVVIVTGASSGIGASFAEKFAAEGAKVALVGRNEQRLNEVAKRCEKNGNTLAIVADVTKDEDSKRIVEQTVTRFGQIDILINNAGLAGTKAITDDDVMQDYERVMNTNLRSIVYLTHLASKYLIETKGSIVNISSVASETTFNPLYCASKAGLDHFSRTVAAELAPKGIRVNVINPGPVATDILVNMGLDKKAEAEYFENITKATVLKRVSDPDEISDLGLYLVSNKARGITGSCFRVDNGLVVLPRA